MLIDHVIIKVAAGKGGNGSVSFSKIMMSLGPTGGSGGTGGNVFLEAVADLGALRHFRSTKEFEAEDGLYGRQAFRDGNRGKDLILKVPRGTIVRNLETKKEYELTQIGEQFLVAKGGRGGRGNFQFRSSTNTSPKQAEPGRAGESAQLELELKLIADIGLVGFPNIGKSSFLNEVTNAQSRVANYEFTTLEPNLGVYHSLVLADIPGLIEGASEGKGLGIKFLRHIERTNIIFHFIDAASPDPVANYETIRGELGAYNPLLLKKKEYIVISKSDTVGEKALAKIIAVFKRKKTEAIAISIYNLDQMNAMRKLLDEIETGIKKPLSK